MAMALKKIKGCFNKLFNAVTNDYWITHDVFHTVGCSLRPKDIHQRSVRIASWFAGLLATIALSAVYIYRQVSHPSLYSGVIIMSTASWIGVYAFIWIAHFLWILSFMIGKRIGFSSWVWGMIEKQWGKRIDEITEKLMNQNRELEGTGLMGSLAEDIGASGDANARVIEDTSDDDEE